jgi:hypothetical protein
VFLPRRILPPNVGGAARAAALSLTAATATLSATSAGLAQTAHTDPCAYLSDGTVSVALGGNVVHAAVSNEFCVYRSPGQSPAVAVIDVVTGNRASARFSYFRRRAGDRSRPIAGLGDAAFAIGSNVFALRGETFILVSVGKVGASQAARWTASIELTRAAAKSQVAVVPARRFGAHR